MLDANCLSSFSRYISSKTFMISSRSLSSSGSPSVPHPTWLGHAKAGIICSQPWRSDHIPDLQVRSRWWSVQRYAAYLFFHQITLYSHADSRRQYHLLCFISVNLCAAASSRAEGRTYEYQFFFHSSLLRWFHSSGSVARCIFVLLRMAQQL